MCCGLGQNFEKGRTQINTNSSLYRTIRQKPTIIIAVHSLFFDCLLLWLKKTFPIWSKRSVSSCAITRAWGSLSTASSMIPPTSAISQKLKTNRKFSVRQWNTPPIYATFSITQLWNSSRRARILLTASVSAAYARGLNETAEKFWSRRRRLVLFSTLPT